MILAFDFDGVICDSAGETAISGWEAAMEIWPEMKTAKLTASSIEAFRKCRPVLETGFQSILINRLLYNGHSVATIINDSTALFDSVMHEDELDKEELIDRFGTARDQWIDGDFESWLAAHAFYPGVVEKINRLCKLYPAFIITTKEKRFAAALADYAGVFIQEKAIFGLESGKKIAVLEALAKRYPGEKIHFFEDRLKTIESISRAGISTYLATWGYCLEQDKVKAESLDRITVLSIFDFLNFEP